VGTKSKRDHESDDEDRNASIPSIEQKYKPQLHSVMRINLPCKPGRAFRRN